MRISDMSAEQYAEWFLSWCNPYGAAKNTRRDLTIGICKADEVEFQEAVLHHICVKHPDVAYLEDEYIHWKDRMV